MLVRFNRTGPINRRVNLTGLALILPQLLLLQLLLPPPNYPLCFSLPLSLSLMGKPEEEEHARDDDAKKKETKGHIKIPSYQEVFGGGGGGGGGHSSSSSSPKPYNPPPPSSFSQAFSFLKSSEFYTPPPQPQPQPQPQPPPEDTQR